MMRYSIRGPHKGPALLATAVALATVAACSGGSPSGSGTPAASSGTTSGTSADAAPTGAPPSPTPTPTPTPTRTYPLSTAPRTVPAVRDHEAARGPGWKPAPSGGVVLAANSAGLADEGRLLAGELGIPTAAPSPPAPETSSWPWAGPAPPSRTT